MIRATSVRKYAGLISPTFGEGAQTSEKNERLKSDGKMLFFFNVIVMHSPLFYFNFNDVHGTCYRTRSVFLGITVSLLVSQYLLRKEKSRGNALNAFGEGDDGDIEVRLFLSRASSLVTFLLFGSTPTRYFAPCPLHPCSHLPAASLSQLHLVSPEARTTYLACSISIVSIRFCRLFLRAESLFRRLKVDDRTLVGHGFCVVNMITLKCALLSMLNVSFAGKKTTTNANDKPGSLHIRRHRLQRYNIED